MILQPLVENAIKHGVSKRRGSSSIVIAARKDHDTLCLSVWNEGPRMALPEGNTMTEGVGLANTRSRLRQLYGDSASLSVRNKDRGGVIAEITIPFTTSSTHEDEASDG
jgi:sensor histidine kinase YesM